MMNFSVSLLAGCQYMARSGMRMATSDNTVLRSD